MVNIFFNIDLYEINLFIFNTSRTVCETKYFTSLYIFSVNSFTNSIVFYLCFGTKCSIMTDSTKKSFFNFILKDI